MGPQKGRIMETIIFCLISTVVGFIAGYAAAMSA